MKAFVQNALVDYQDDEDNEATGVADPKERCCRIAFAPDFHIDVPCYHLDSERDARMLATETKGWEVSDPKQIYECFKNCQDDVPRKKLRRLIRYLKMWGPADRGGRASVIDIADRAGRRSVRQH